MRIVAQVATAKLGVQVTDEAIDRRFTNEFVTFLEEILKQAVAQALAAKAAATPLLLLENPELLDYTLA